MKTRLVTFLAINFCLGATAQPYTLEWCGTGVRGGQSAGGGYSLSGTIGQRLATALSGGSYALDSGFGIDLPFVPTPNAPEIAVMLAPSTVILSWPLNAAEFVLEQASALPGDSNSWLRVPAGSYQTNDLNFSIVLPVSPGCKYFRLRRL